MVKLIARAFGESRLATAEAFLTSALNFLNNSAEVNEILHMTGGWVSQKEAMHVNLDIYHFTITVNYTL